jgi:hypothetical protein
VGQALTGAKLHKIRIKDTHRSHLKGARVKGIGPGMSEVSDVMTVQVALYDQVEEDGRPDSDGLLPLFSVAWLFLAPIENAGE